MKIKPTESEIEVLALIWQQGPLTVRQIHDQIKTSRDIGYTTTLKIMHIMFEKGLLERSKQGKTHLYDAVESPNEIQDGLLNKMVKTVFHGSTKDLIMQALGSAKASKEELEEIRAYLDKLEKEKK
ncbi:MAG: BlaI/MecI/CopY family transcriptional regulator [Bacteroidetes bacterium]|nr:MAG: BlaI/MecI/CopY family transcriptional regulator [Bacteroidota bacterium]